MGIPKLLRRRLCWPELLPGYDPPVILAPEQERGTLPALEPPLPVRPAMHEYKWPESKAGPTVTFSIIISQNGAVHSAIAVWLDGNAIRYLTPEGAGGRSALDSIDREATRSANAKTLQSPDLSGLTR
jgi:hypothetical protein